MARRKTTRKQITTKSVQASKFPAEYPPLELTHMIFAYLEPTEAANFRWAGRVVAEIGIQYLVPTVYLRLNEESYDRLFAISEHPVASKYVVELECETEGLRPMDRGYFDQMMRKTWDTPEIASSFTNARDQRAYERELIYNPPRCTNIQTTRRLNQAWSTYEASLVIQKKLQQAGFFREKIVEAMKRFRNLVVISTPAHSIYHRYIAFVKVLLPNYDFSDLNVYEAMSNVSATNVVLLAVGSASLPIRSLCCQHLNWQTFLQQDKDNFTVLKRGLSHLQTMTVSFSEPRSTDSYDHNQAVEPVWAACLNEGLVKDFITSSPNLKSLSLSFYACLPDVPTMPQSIFSAFIGNSCWASLEAVSLDWLESSEHDLVDFLKRHAHTLKDLSLRNMRLDEGSWSVAFHRIRQAFRLGQQLDGCILGGEFDGPSDFYLMDLRSEGNAHATSIILSDYIRTTNFGDITVDEYYKAMGYH